MNNINVFHLALKPSNDDKHLDICVRAIPQIGLSMRYWAWYQVSIEALFKEEFRTRQALGQALYRLLFISKDANHAKFEKAFQQCRAQLSAERSAQLRLVIEIQANPANPSRLFSLPWELLHDGENWLLEDRRLSLVRMVNADELPNLPPTEPPLTVLLAYVAPSSGHETESQEFFKAVEQELQPIQPLRLDPLPEATRQKLFDAIRQGVDVVHFLVHGDIDSAHLGIGQLALRHDESPVADPLSATELHQWIRNARKRPRLVVLTACHGGHSSAYGFLGIATTLLDAGVEVVVAMHTELHLDEAQNFARAFYKELAQRRRVDDAMNAGRAALPLWRQRKFDIHASQLLKDSKIIPLKINYPAGWSKPKSDETEDRWGFPGWAVPTLFLRNGHDEGLLGQSPPRPSLIWPRDGKEMVYIIEGGFYIDKYPVTRREYRHFLRESGWLEPARWKFITGKKVLGVIESLIQQTDWNETYIEERLPATHVTLHDARAYADWAGKRIPTPDEWRTAALAGCASTTQSYPWEGGFKGDRCNTRERGYGVPWPVVLGDENSAGMRDIVGNVAEWTWLPTSAADQLALAGQPPDDTIQAFLCGGSYKESGKDCSVQKRHAVAPTWSKEGVGFRCVAYWEDILNEHKLIQPGPE